MPLQAGALLADRYRVSGILGRGGFGAVYRATDEHLGLDCAIKENLSLSPASERQFRREAQLLATLRHPHLPRVTNHFLSGGHQYLVMDYVEGEDLAKRLEQEGRLAEADVLVWTEQICSALEYLHRRQPPVIHRDVKPANIKITPTGEVVLVDFGIAKAWTAGQATTTGAKGVTPGFAPPEQYDLGQTDPSSDVYALGATLYALLTHHQPPDSVDRLLGMARLIPPELLRPDLSPNVSAAIQRAMEVGQEARFATVAEFAAALAEPSFQHHPTELVQQMAGAQEETRTPRRQGLVEWLHGIGGWLRANLRAGLATLGILIALAVIFVGPMTLLEVAGSALGIGGRVQSPPEPTEVLQPADFAGAIPTLQPTVARAAASHSPVAPTATPPAVPATAANASAWRLFGSWRTGEGTAPFAMNASGDALLLVSRQGVDSFDLLSGERVAELQGFVIDREVLQIAPLQASLLVQFPEEILEYDLTTRNLISRLRIPGTDMRVSPDGRTLAVLLTHVSLLDLRSGVLIAMLEDARLPADFAFSPDGQYLAVTHQTGVRLYQTRSGRVVRTLEGHGEPAEGLAFTSDGSRLVSAGGDVWDVASGEPLAVFDSSTRRATVSPNGELIVGEDGTVWELESGQALGRIPFSSAGSRRLQFVPDGALLIRQATDGAVELWAVDPHAARAAAVPQAPATLPIGEPITPLNVWRLGQAAQLGTVASGRYAVSPGWTSAVAWSERRVTLTSLISGDVTHELTSSGQVLDAAYLGDEYLLVVNSQGLVERWDVGTGQLRQTYPYRGHRVEGSPGGGMFAVQEKYVQVVDAVTGERLFNLGSAVRIEELYPEAMRPAGGFRPGFGPEDLGQDFAFTPQGDHLAIAFASGVSLWDLDSGRSVRQFSGHGPNTGGLTFTPDGSRLVSSSGDVWDAESGRRLAEFELQAEAVAVSPGGELIAGGDGSLWDGETGQYLGTLGVQAMQLWFTPNSRQLVLHVERGGVLVYAIQPKGQHTAPPGDSSRSIALAPLSVGSASRLSLIGWWGEDGLLQVRNERDRSAPGADRFGTQTYRHLAPSPDGALVAALDAQGVDLLDPASGRLADRYRMFLNPLTIRELAFLGGHLLLLKEAAGLERWDLADQELVQRYDLQGEGLLAGPDGTAFVLLQGNRLLLVTAASGEVRAEITVSPGSGNYLFSPDGTLLAVVRGATVELWEAAEARRARILRGQGGPVHGLAFSHDGERLMAASGQIWEVGSGNLVGTFETAARLLASSPQAGLFVGDDGALRSLQQGDRIGTLIDRRAAAAQLLFRRDGQQLVWRAEDGRVYAYGVRALSPPARSTPGESALNATEVGQLTLLTHLGRGRLRQVLWSPDDRYLALNTTQNAVIYEAESLLPVRSLLDATALAFDAHGQALIGGESPLRLLKVETGEVARSFGQLGISAAAFSPDGTTLVIAGKVSPESDPDGLALVNLSSGLLRQLDLGGGGSGAPLAVQFSPDGQTVVLSFRGMISLWDVNSGQQLRAPIRGNSRPASISPDGRLIAYFTNRFVIERLDTGGERRTINADGTPYFPTGLDIPSLRPVDYQFAPQGRLLVFYRRLDRRTFEEDLALVEWDLTATPIRAEVRLQGMLMLSNLGGEHAQDYANESPQLIPAFGLSPRGSLFYSLTGDGVLRVWNARDGRRLASSQADTTDRMAIGLDGQAVVIADALGVLEVWDLGGGGLLRTVPGTWENEWLAYASATTLAMLQPEGSLAIVDLQTGEALDRLELKPYGGPAYFALGPDGRTYAQMALLAGRNSLQFYGMAPDLPLLDLDRYPLPSRPVFSPDGQTLAVVNRNRVLLWDLQSGALRGELQGLGSSVGPLTFTPDGSRLIAGSGEIWEVESGVRTAQFETNSPSQRIACNGYLIVGEQGNLWDASNGASLGVLAGLRGPALNFGFTPDGSRLLWQIQDGVVEVWGVSLE